MTTDRTYATYSFSHREESFLIAAIRLWQQLQFGGYSLRDPNGMSVSLDSFDDILTNGWIMPALTAVELEDMATEVFHLDPWLSDDEYAAAGGVLG